MAETGSRDEHSIALWAGVTAFLSNVAALNLVALFGADKPIGRLLAGGVTASCVAGSIYARQRWEDAKATKEHDGDSTSRD